MKLYTDPAAGATRRRVLQTAAACVALPASKLSLAAGPIVIGIDGEFQLEGSLSAQAVGLGVRIALAEIEAKELAGPGRRFEVVERDHGSIAARGIRNLREFAAMPGLLAVFAGRFSPVVLEQLPVVRETRTLLLAPWSSADGIVDNGMSPNYVFRLSLRDSLAMPFMLRTAWQRGHDRVGLLLTNTGWGRSNDAAARRHQAVSKHPRVVETAWYNFGDRSLVEPYRRLVAAGAQAVIVVGNDDEGALLVREVATLPAAERVPLLSHWGVTGGEFARRAGEALGALDFSVVQTFSFFDLAPTAWRRFAAAAHAFGIQRPEDIKAPVGVAHAYDLMHVLARAVARSGSIDRDRVREALEHVPSYDGLIRRYAPAFTPTRHEALDDTQLLMAKYRNDGTLVPDRRKPLRA